MSFDSLDALHESRTGIHWNINCPTMLIFIQHICDRLYPGAALLFLLQVSIVFISLAYILFVSEIPVLFGIPFMLLFALNPAILGPMLVVWKDVGMMAFFLAAIVFLFRAQKHLQITAGAANVNSIIYMAVGFTFLACAFRLNAIFAAIPIFFAIAKLLARAKPNQVFIYLLSLLISIAAIVYFINSYKCKPNFSLVDPYPSAFFQAFDILGISALSGQNLLPKELYAQYDKFGIDDLRLDYYPENSNKAFVKVLPEQKPLVWKCPLEQMTSLWKNAIFSHLHAYLGHRAQVFKALLAINMKEPYYLTHPSIDANDYGIKFSPSRLSMKMLQYLNAVSTTIFAHPWFYYLIACFLLLLSIFYPSCRSDNVMTLLTSAMLNVLPMFFLVASAELRFNLWSIVAIMLASLLFINRLLKPQLKLWQHRFSDR